MTEEDLFIEFENQFEEKKLNDIENVTTLENAALVQAFNEVELKLRVLAELHVPKTQEGRDLHSKRYAYQLVLRERNII